eukprot:15483925-Alexandrium_andersonii.AAC.1
MSREIVLSANSAQCFVPRTARMARSSRCMNRAARLPRPSVSTKCGTASMSGTAASAGSDTRACT